MKSSNHNAASRAFELAYFIHPQRDAAFAITAQAVLSLQEQLKPQQKRVYYRLRGRISGGLTVRARTKITLQDSQKLQLLIYVYSEKVERQQQADFLAGVRSERCINEEDWIIRFVKHALATSAALNSFYVTLAIGRIIFNYTTEEVAEIYDAIVPDENCKKDVPYFRKRKNEVLMKSLKERFGCLLQIHVGAHGEERFKQRSDSQRFLPVIKECLHMFTPWNTECVLPERLNPMTEPIEELCFRDEDPDKEHPIEVRRMHTLIHPNCFERLIASLELSRPAERLEVPMFFLKQPVRENSNDGMGGAGNNDSIDRRKPAQLTAEESAQIETALEEQRKRRKRATPEVVSVMVDGVERAIVKLDHRLPMSLCIDDVNRLIEFKGTDSEGELLLGSLLIDKHEMLSATTLREYRLRLAGGLQLMVWLSPQQDTNGEFQGANLEFTFRRVRSLGMWQRVIDGAREQPRLILRNPVLTFVSLILLSGALVSVILWRRSSVPPDYVAQVESQPFRPPSGSPSADLTNAASSNQEAASQRSPAVKQNDPTRNPKEPNHNTESDEGVRALPAEIVVELSNVQKIYVEEGSDKRLREIFSNTVNASGRLRTTDKAIADAFLRWEIRNVGATKRIELRLISRNGKALWKAFKTIQPGFDRSVTARLLADQLVGKLNQ